MICNGLIDTYKTANMFLLTPVILRYNMVSNNIVPLQTSSLFHSAGVSISPGYKLGRIQKFRIRTGGANPLQPTLRRGAGVLTPGITYENVFLRGQRGGTAAPWLPLDPPLLIAWRN